MRNVDLKFINLAPWDVPRPYRDPDVRAILNHILTMQPGQAIQVQDLPQERVTLVRSALWRQIKRHELDARVIMRGGYLIVKKE